MGVAFVHGFQPAIDRLTWRKTSQRHIAETTDMCHSPHTLFFKSP
jgi:hypothetical protein